jgi:EAL domain-containing protein (putative c-di-GMP-specific phosphodiesterase class I)
MSAVARPDPDDLDGQALAAALGEAIEQQRLQLFYQPIVSLVDRVASAVEALPRWPREGREILAPTDFIDVAARFGLLTVLERWSIAAAFEQLGRWRRSTDLDVSLNLSEDRVYESALPEEIQAAAKRNSVHPSRLSFEISETALIEAEDDRLGKLRQLSTLGVGLIVDDYTGALPKQWLGELPVSGLKISRRVVAGIPDGARPTETAVAAIRLARELNLKVIANGIESPGQLAAIREMGCEYGQGFLFSIPMPAEVLAERIERR